MVVSRATRLDRRTGRRSWCHAPSSGQQKHNTRSSRSGRLTSRILSLNSLLLVRTVLAVCDVIHCCYGSFWSLGADGRPRNPRVPRLIKAARMPTRIPLATCARCTACCCCCCCCCMRVCRVCASLCCTSDNTVSMLNELFISRR